MCVNRRGIVLRMLTVCKKHEIGRKKSLLPIFYMLMRDPSGRVLFHFPVFAREIPWERLPMKRSMS